MSPTSYQTALSRVVYFKTYLGFRIILSILDYPDLE